MIMAAARGVLKRKTKECSNKIVLKRKHSILKFANRNPCGVSQFSVVSLHTQVANDGRVFEPVKTFSLFFFLQETQTYLGPSQRFSTYKVLDLIQHAQF